MSLRKRFHQNWKFYSPDAILTCSVLHCNGKQYIAFGGHDKRLYLMDKDQTLHDSVTLDGWCRCSFPIDLDGDGSDELLVGAGDGNFLVLKLDPERETFVTIMNYVTLGKVLTCVSGDIFRNGNNELIFGGEDKTLKIFKDIKSTEPLYTFYYDSWVMACNLGIFKHSEFSKPIYGLVVGTKSGILELMVIKDTGPDILWREYLYSQINDIAIGDVINDGEYEIVVATDDSYVKVFDCEGYRFRYIKIDGGRPLTLLIEDIDGDGANEILVGCSDGSLRVFHNTEIDSIGFQLKWKMKAQTSIKGITYLFNEEDGVYNIIFGGYDRTLRNLTDHEYGKKPKMKIKPSPKLPAITIPKVDSHIADSKPVPKNLRETVEKLLKSDELILSIDDLKDKLKKRGHPVDLIENEIAKMQEKKLIITEKKEIEVWALGKGEIPKEAKPTKKTAPKGVKKVAVEIDLEETKPDREKKEITLSTEEDIEKDIIAYIKTKKLVATKAALVKAIVSKGYKEEQVTETVEVLRTNNKIKFSRTAPKGWSVSEE